jgi:hypothetical protein
MKVAQRAAGVYFEGEEAPERLAALVEDFQKLMPDASPQQWATFALSLARSSYQEGYVRGYERSERVPGSALPKHPPELTADAMGEDWEWRSPLQGMDAPVDAVDGEEIEPGPMPRPEPDEG